MRWRSSRQSTNVEDRRTSGSGGGGMGRGFHIGWMGTVAIVLVGWYMGVSPSLSK
jgi:hypothetical protein